MNEVDPGLEALVRLSAAVAAGADQPLKGFLEAAHATAQVVEVEEALLQSYLFLGYPAALNALGAWRRVSGVESPARRDGSWRAWSERGEVVCGTVYGRAYPSLRRNIAGLSAEMDEWMVTEGYGKVLGRPGLELWRRECCIVAILAVLGTAPQLRSHLRGALRTGAHPDTVERVLDLALECAPRHRHERAREAWKDVLRRWEDA